jgi:hypothetical protein
LKSSLRDVAGDLNLSKGLTDIIKYTQKESNRIQPEEIDLQLLSQRKDPMKNFAISQVFHSPKKVKVTEQYLEGLMDKNFNKTGIVFYDYKNISKASDEIGKMGTKFPSRNKSIHKMEREKKVLEIANEKNGKINFEKLLFQGNARDIFYPKTVQETNKFRHRLSNLAPSSAKSRTKSCKSGKSKAFSLRKSKQKSKIYKDPLA